jgi:hypothetical protein
MTNNTPHTPTDDGENSELQGRLAYHLIEYSDNRQTLPSTIRNLEKLYHQYGDTRAVEALEAIKNKARAFKVPDWQTMDESGQVNAVPIIAIQAELEALTQPQREDK